MKKSIYYLVEKIFKNILVHIKNKNEDKVERLFKKAYIKSKTKSCVTRIS